MHILVTGGSGFIGSAVCRHFILDLGWSVTNVDCLTYAAAAGSLRAIEGKPNYRFAKIDICDGPAISSLLKEVRPDAIIHLAAESHVDRSIDGPLAFIRANVHGTACLLEAAREYYGTLTGEAKQRFRFHHVSTDEVYGSLDLTSSRFTETTSYDPSSPYSASKAASDHLARSWHRTFGLPVIVTNCSNNYGPFHFPEKLIPLMIIKALSGKPMPVYGNGGNIRDWLFVEDHARALGIVLARGRPGETYNIGGDAEQTNLAVVEAICEILDTLHPQADGRPAKDLITFVEDRPGHDMRYAVDTAKIHKELGWSPSVTFADGLKETVKWYIDNRWWWSPILEAPVSDRLGTLKQA